MSFLSLRSSSRPSTYHVLDLPDTSLVQIFQRCSPADLTRCALACRRFRELIEDEEEKDELSRSLQRARIFVCDRRRAILERICTIVPTKLPRKKVQLTMSRNSSKDTISSRSSQPSSRRTTSGSTSETPSIVQSPIPFIADQYTNISEPNWAFKFDFSHWNKTFEVTEVFFKNFCSFIDREHTEMELAVNLNNNNNNHLQVKMAEFSLSPESSGSEPTASEAVDLQRAYDRLPSSQATTSDLLLTKLHGQSVEGMKRISAGRVEHLAKIVEPISPLHLIFRDFCCYHHRPPAFIFWFINMTHRHLHRLTFHDVQAARPVEAHTMLSLANIDQLTVIQPANNRNMLIKGHMLLSWLRLPTEERKKITIHLTGCTELTPRGLASFVSAWKLTPEPAIFNKITLDGGSMRYHELFAELEHVHRDENPVTRPPSPPLGANQDDADERFLQKTLLIKHTKKPSAYLRFAYSKSKRIVLQCTELETSRMKTLPVANPVARIVRTHSAVLLNVSPSHKDAQRRPMLRPLSQNTLQNACREEKLTPPEQRTIVDRVMRFLATSS